MISHEEISQIVQYDERRGRRKVGVQGKERLNEDYRHSINSLWSKRWKDKFKKNLVNDSLNGDFGNLRCFLYSINKIVKI